MQTHFSGGHDPHAYPAAVEQLTCGRFLELVEIVCCVILRMTTCSFVIKAAIVCLDRPVSRLFEKLMALTLDTIGIYWAGEYAP